MGKKPATTEEEEALPDHLRCGRTDGRQWRCRRRVKENLKLCEIHYLQGRHRQFKEKVPESLKLQRKRKKNKKDPVVNLSSNAEIRAQRMKKKRKISEALGSKKKGFKLKNGDSNMQLELIRMVLQREVEKRKKTKKMKKEKEEEDYDDEETESDYNEEELKRELPNGVMAISQASTPHHYSNVGPGSQSHCDVKVGVDYRAVTPRYFRSKNVDRISGGKLQVVPYGPNLKGKGRRKKCHWCQRSDSWKLIKCSSCQNKFFCMDCIKEGSFDTPYEVKKACPVCRGTCVCKDCLSNQRKDSESKEYLAGKSRVDRILHCHYLICMLLPVLNQISDEQKAVLETEAKINGKELSDTQMKQVDFGYTEKICCNHCKRPVLDLHRSCLSCSYSLCLTCCQKLNPGRTSGGTNSSMFKLPDKLKACISMDEKSISSGNLTGTSVLPEWTNCNGIDNISCPPTELGGCGNSHLDLRCTFPLSWIKEMEVKAEEIVCSYDFPETSDKSSSCSLCFDTDHKSNRFKLLQEAAFREDSNDNCLFYPTVLDINGNNFEHFQKHWGKGHPMVVRDVLQSSSNLNWDPLIMFCNYLERSIARYENNKELLESCLDWCEVEINIRQYFAGSLKRRPQKNTCHEMLKLKGWLSSQLFKDQFPTHFAEVIDALPVQEYMNPMSGLLNLAAKLPQGSSNHENGPYVYISYGCADKEASSVTKLCYDSYDVVNIMAHTTDVPLTTELLTKVRKLLKKQKALCQRESSKISTEQLQEQKVNGIPLLDAQDMEQKEWQSMTTERKDFFRRVNRTSCISTETQKLGSRSIDNNADLDGECDIFSDSDSDSESTLPLHGCVQSTELFTRNNSINPSRSSNSKRSKFTELSGAQWDVFRRQDVPKLIEYLKKHCDEPSYTGDYHHKKMVHPILDQSLFLDSTHKKRLKEEFKIEPWTFQQHVGEAVIIPAGCPYQIRNSKCCVHVVLEFMSPENVSECIKLMDEVRLLPDNHKAKVDKLEVKKLALHSMSAAIKEVHELTCKT
ncbi:unnamed protein product [Lupinus luteus]|uniref:Lysine-specific demethylase JMJ25 n=1 Tax=Lupinus luteus TaxID=3873 RepID=A0AAV1WSM4_LUPLU